MTFVGCTGQQEKITQVEPNSDAGVIYAKPENISTNISLEKVLAVSEYFNVPENKVKMQFPTEQAQYAW